MSAVQVHGGAVDEMRMMFPDAPEPWVDLSTGINPWPWSAQNWNVDSLCRLPTQSDLARCVTAMAAAFDAPEHSILVAPGSELLIHLLPTVLKPRRVAVQAPSYGDHARVWRAAGCEVIETPAPLDEAAVTDAVVICNPNNPDGRHFEPSQIEDAQCHLRERGGWLIIDEAFADLEPCLSWASRVEAGNLIVLRSTGKFFGLAGLRLGAWLGPRDVHRSMAERLGYWSVSTLALATGAAAYADRDWQTKTRRRLADARRRLDHLLDQGKICVAGGTDLFRYVQVTDAGRVWRRLAKQGVYVRKFPWTGRHLRIGLPKDADAENRLLNAICS